MKIPPGIIFYDLCHHFEMLIRTYGSAITKQFRPTDQIEGFLEKIIILLKHLNQL